MRDDEVTVDTFIEQRTIYGSPKTVLSKLLALRESRAVRHAVGQLGRLGWSQRAWERESLSRLAQEVMPAFREQTAAA